MFLSIGGSGGVRIENVAEAMGLYVRTIHENDSYILFKKYTKGLDFLGYIRKWILCSRSTIQKKNPPVAAKADDINITYSDL